MTDSNVVLVMLRQPKRKDPNEMRTDPFWEFGSFGCTRCHQKNLMNPRKLDELEGRRLAFAQGGASEVRLVHVTPPVTMVDHGQFGEATWRPIEMPFTFESAPILINNEGASDTPELTEMINHVRRDTMVAKFASKFRSRRTPLPLNIGREIVDTYRRFRGRGSTISRHYVEALPYLPPCVDQDRRRTYESLF